ncbi:MAG TPA: 8-oxoguanine deaminase, partial [Gammaproteobacteria bacterium]|nr:8-oxoguanine deaminase [Gammaproteobacteria bacterium]
SGYDDPMAALVLCGASRADRVMIAGNWKVIDGYLPKMDEPDLIRRHSSTAEKLRRRLDL